MIHELRQMTITNFADKRDKGFPFLPSSIASLHRYNPIVVGKNLLFFDLLPR
jgi:hypothetical protein